MFLTTDNSPNIAFLDSSKRNLRQSSLEARCLTVVIHTLLFQTCSKKQISAQDLPFLVALVIIIVIPATALCVLPDYHVSQARLL